MIRLKISSSTILMLTQKPDDFHQPSILLRLFLCPTDGEVYFDEIREWLSEPPGDCRPSTQSEIVQEESRLERVQADAGYRELKEADSLMVNVQLLLYMVRCPLICLSQNFGGCDFHLSLEIFWFSSVCNHLTKQTK